VAAALNPRTSQAVRVAAGTCWLHGVIPKDLGRIWSITRIVSREACRLYNDVRGAMHLAEKESRFLLMDRITWQVAAA
jgi:hypothetical protein